MTIPKKNPTERRGKDTEFYPTYFEWLGHPKELIETIAEDLLDTFRAAPLLDAYDVYQHLMDYWAETMQDDAYLIVSDGWVNWPNATPRRCRSLPRK